ncbi:right-handed parallel beta-helix repeat-containing protein [Deinococcus misasensis]|uniref:right-handed parallel beta-helix repeat-containing protein n=1 Tax=Deinococcus misasensis TaxID=392413 RepID=UPI00054FF39A|nr:right-handed parallel beta-helix repeat-containing protein [Deinococcus misasensis]
MLRLHGIKRKSWVQLQQTAHTHQDHVIVNENVENWLSGAKGDVQVVVMSDDYSMEDAQTFTVSSIEGNRINFKNGRLNKARNIGRQSYDSMTFEKEVEVGLLTQNITIQSEVQNVDVAKSYAQNTASGVTTTNYTINSQMGGHIMAHMGGKLYLSNIEISNMGQEGQLGRYPVHWHELGDASGQYIENSSIHDSFNRCITVHSTNNVRVSGNFCHDIIGHAYFLEDGDETGNRFDRNLGAVIRRPNPKNTVAQDKAQDRNTVYSVDGDLAKRGNEAMGPTTYWISNGKNTFTNNVSAGSDGSGYWYVSHSPQDFIPRGNFDRNASHSEKGFSLVVTRDDMGIVNPQTPSIFTNYSFHHTNARGIWSHAHDMEFIGVRAANNRRAIFFSFDSRLQNALIIGRNNFEPDTDPNPHAAYTFYDGPAHLYNVAITGFTNKDVLFPTQGAATRFMNHKLQLMDIDDSIPLDAYFDETLNLIRFC